MTTHLRASSGAARLRVLAVAVAALMVAALAVASPADAKPRAVCDRQNNNTYQKLLDCLTAEGALEHEQAFQDIATNSDDPTYSGSRAAGTEGYQDSVDYVVDTLEAAGWTVELDPVDVTFVLPAVLEQLTPVQADYETGAYTGSGDGSVEGNLVPVDLALDGDRASTSACQAEDFDGLDFSGNNDIALIQRGACNFGDKAARAEEAGAEAVIIFNQGNAPDREGLIVANASTLTQEAADELGLDSLSIQHGIPVVGATFAAGVALAQDGATALVEVLPIQTRTDYNVIAELPGENDDNVVMAGAHLDSVTVGPGINDNGSGSAALLEVAQSISKLEPVNTLRFAWWAAEEQGLVGSTDYVAGLSDDELDRIAAYLNFDMVASPNFIYQVYDADTSSFEPPAGVPIPEGSEAIEDLFEIYYTWQDIPYEDTQFSGRSDYQAFINNGIPSSGLFTGAEVVKTEEQEAIWEGVAGESYDPCYHQSCDNLFDDDESRDADVYAELMAENDLIGNISMEALGVNLDAIAFAVLNLAYSTEAVNGVEGQPVPGSRALRLPTEPTGPESTRAETDGGLHAHHDDLLG